MFQVFAGKVCVRQAKMQHGSWLTPLLFVFLLLSMQVRPGKVNELFVYDNFSRVAVEEVQAGDICAVTGIQDIGVSCCCQ
jgi:predicted membrane GTPase involved in stress response